MTDNSGIASAREELGRRLRRLRLLKGYTQEAVASDLGVCHTTLSAWECGEHAMTVDTLVSLADYFGVSPCELLAEE